MLRIFVSYRRADSKIHADNVMDALRKAFGPDAVQSEIDDIPFGVDTRQYVHNVLVQFDVVLVVIGRNWAIVKDDYNRKLIDNPADMVRLTVEIALQQGKVVVPVLVDQASMPVPSELPEALHELCYRRPVEVQGGMAFQREIKPLIDGLRSLHAPAPPASPAVPPPSPPAPQPPLETAAPTPPPPASRPVTDHAQPVDVPPDQPDPSPPLEVVHVEAESVELPVGVAKVLPPPFEWVTIPAGLVMLPEGTMGTQRSVFVETFQMARYPVTNAQYDAFVQASNGYNNPEWWDYSEQARSWRAANTAPKATGFAGDDLPRTNVSWYEAVAFCRWLTTMVRAYQADYVAGLPGGKQAYRVMLPTEAQWQRAAQGDDRRMFPWGETFNPNFANFKTRQPTAVTHFPKGASPYGVLDMAGNVNEWCLTDFGAESIDLQAASARKRRVLRGGSWGAAAVEDLRVIARLWLLPDYWNGSSGFRIVQMVKQDAR